MWRNTQFEESEIEYQFYFYRNFQTICIKKNIDKQIYSLEIYMSPIICVYKSTFSAYSSSTLNGSSFD